MKSLLRISFLVVVAVAIAFFAQQATAAPGDIVKISELSTWGYQNGDTSTNWKINIDGVARVKFDVLSTYNADYFTSDGRVEKMHLPGGGYQAFAYRLKGNYFLDVCQGRKYYQESGRYRFPLVTREFCQSLSVFGSQERQVLFNVKVEPHEAAEFHLGGDYYVEMREIYCPPDSTSCKWGSWKRIFERKISERREWFVNARIFHLSPLGGTWWKLEREAGILIPLPAPAP